MGWKDPRTEPGALMFPERFPRTVIAGELRRLGSYGFAGQHQQRVAPAAGGILKRQWWKYWRPAHLELPPVSVRMPAEHGTYNNKVSAMFADLPVRIADPVERLATVRVQMQDLKESHQAVAGSTLTSLGGFAPAMLLALAGRVATRTPQHSVNTVTTNVPGPQHAIYLAGQRMLEYFPFVPLGGHVRIGVAAVSYDGALNFGVTGDYETAPDPGAVRRDRRRDRGAAPGGRHAACVGAAPGISIVRVSSSAPFDGSPPSVLVLGGGGLLGEAWMTGVLAGYEDAAGADVRRCRRYVGTSAGSIVAASLVAGRSPPRPGSANRRPPPR